MGDGNDAKCSSELHHPEDVHVQFTDSGADVNGCCDNRLPATVANVAAALMGVAIMWTLLYVNVSPELMAVPSGSLASIFVLYVTGTLAGQLIAKVAGLPPLLGMMLAGIALRNSGLYNVTGWCSHLVSTMRWAASRWSKNAACNIMSHYCMKSYFVSKNWLEQDEDIIYFERYLHYWQLSSLKIVNGSEVYIND